MTWMEDWGLSEATVVILLLCLRALLRFTAGRRNGLQGSMDMVPAGIGACVFLVPLVVPSSRPSDIVCDEIVLLQS